MTASSPPQGARCLQKGQRLVAATHNAGKVRELGDLLAPCGLIVVSAAALGLPEPEETGDTFRANAELKALAAAKASGLPALADDSGLEVHILDGAPGVYAARWAGPGRDFGLAMQKVADEVRARGGWAQEPGPRANFTAVLSLAWPDGHVDAFEGRVYGHLVWPPRGSRGFGYDPMFVADGETLTFGEMEPSRKHAISHRARAFAQFSRACLYNGGA
jgi:XTP/dITP diphosphohydrolase